MDTYNVEPIPSAPVSVTTVGHQLKRIQSSCSEIVLGKSQELSLAITCLLAGGHLLIEDIPGVGKTTLAHTLARALGLQYQRIQFTSDLLPADVLGASVYEQERGQFSFRPGPIFNQVVLADEINRTTPKTQSALLEAMEEAQVTADGQTYPLPRPFFVIATQNPSHQSGTFPLPESQLDRFLMRISLGYPSAAAERQLLAGEDRRELLSRMPQSASPETLQSWRGIVDRIHVSDALLDYVQALLRASRDTSLFVHGLSPRAGLGLLRAARAWALLQAREYVVPEDVQAVLPAVVDHRVSLTEKTAAATPSRLLLETVSIP